MCFKEEVNKSESQGTQIFSLIGPVFFFENHSVDCFLDLKKMA